MKTLLIAFGAALIVGIGAASGMIAMRPAPPVVATDSLKAARLADSAKVSAAHAESARLPDSTAKKDSIVTTPAPGIASETKSAGAVEAPRMEPAAAPSSATRAVTPPQAATLPEHRIARVFATMAPRDAAKVLEQMSDSDIATILGDLTDKQVGLIMAKLPAPRVAALGKSATRSTGTKP